MTVTPARVTRVGGARPRRRVGPDGGRLRERRGAELRHARAGEHGSEQCGWAARVERSRTRRPKSRARCCCACSGCCHTTRSASAPAHPSCARGCPARRLLRGGEDGARTTKAWKRPASEKDSTTTASEQALGDLGRDGQGPVPNDWAKTAQKKRQRVRRVYCGARDSSGRASKVKIPSRSLLARDPSRPA